MSTSRQDAALEPYEKWGGINLMQIDWIAEQATRTVAAEFRRYRFTASPPRVTPAMVRIVLEKAQEAKWKPATTYPRGEES